MGILIMVAGVEHADPHKSLATHQQPETGFFTLLTEQTLGELAK
jgi:hypothetical protein